MLQKTTTTHEGTLTPMKKISIALLAVLAVGASSSAYAQSGTITFTGEVTASTCEVTFPGNGGTTLNPTIALATVSTGSLAAAGATAGHKPFQIQIGSTGTPCEIGTGVALELNPNHTDAITNGRLDNTAAGGAENVQIQLRDATGAPIFLSSTPWISPRVPFAAGVATLGFEGEYYASEAAGAGDVSASLQYTLDYN